jgi:phosphoglycolate phosphatase
VNTALVLFDIDGTLVRGAGAHHRQALIDGIFRVTGVATHLEGVATSGMLDRDLIAVMLEEAGCRDARIRETIDEIMGECQDAYCASCTIDLSHTVCPGVRNTLAELRDRGAALGLVTGNLSRIAWRKLELAGLREFFSTGAFAEDGQTRSELAGVAARRAMESGVVSAGCRVSLIGDHPNDVRAAKANRFLAVAVATGLIGMEELRAEGPDVVVESLEKLDVRSLL